MTVLHVELGAELIDGSFDALLVGQTLGLIHACNFLLRLLGTLVNIPADNRGL
jgi:hypothetical protein